MRLITVQRIHTGITSDIVFICERPKEDHKLFFFFNTKGIRQLENTNFRSVQ